mmetsp:Transcript_143649/g.364625  ORF Transcript_143649/g.364625 Transcript_143649/m.364625 type:complete len:111 (+) Transcript_143649:1980-2312(+)
MSDGVGVCTLTGFAVGQPPPENQPSHLLGVSRVVKAGAAAAASKGRPIRIDCLMLWTECSPAGDGPERPVAAAVRHALEPKACGTRTLHSCGLSVQQLPRSRTRQRSIIF